MSLFQPNGHHENKENDYLNDIFHLEFYSDNFRFSSYYKAIVHGRLIDLFNAFYVERADITLVDEIFGSTFLHLTASTAQANNESHFVPFIYALCNFWLDPNQPDNSGQTSLAIAVKRGLCSIVIALLRCGACQFTNDLMPCLLEPCHSTTLELCHWLDVFKPGLWEAVASNNYNATRRMVQLWCKIRISRHGQSLLAFARQQQVSSLLIEHLEDRRATVEFIHASLAGDEHKMLEILQNRNVDRYAEDELHRVRFINQGCERSAAMQLTMACSLRQTVLDLGHTHIIYLLPANRMKTRNLLLCEGTSLSNFMKKEHVEVAKIVSGTCKSEHSQICILL